MDVVTGRRHQSAQDLKPKTNFAAFTDCGARRVLQVVGVVPHTGCCDDTLEKEGRKEGVYRHLNESWSQLEGVVSPFLQL